MTPERPQRARAKTRITIRFDAVVLDWFRKQVAEAGGGNYQTLMNDALRQHVTRQEGTLAETLRRVVREELARKTRRIRMKKAKRVRKVSRRRRLAGQSRLRVRSRSRRKPVKRSRKRHK
jgi:hypothetical protein